MAKLIKDCEFNYFELFHRVGNAATTEELISELDITSNEKKQLKISHEAFLAEEDINALHKWHQADQMNGLIVTESESDDPGAIQDATNVMDESITEIVIKKRTQLRDKFNVTQKSHEVCWRSVKLWQVDNGMYNIKYTSHMIVDVTNAS